MYTNRKIHIRPYCDLWRGKEAPTGDHATELTDTHRKLQGVKTQIPPLEAKRNALQQLVDVDIPYMQSNLDTNFGADVVRYTEQRSQAIDEYNQASNTFSQARDAEVSIGEELTRNVNSMQSQMLLILDDDPEASAKQSHNQQIADAIGKVREQAQIRIKEQHTIQQDTWNRMQQIGGANPDARDETIIGRLNQGFDSTRQQYEQTKISNERWKEMKKGELNNVTSEIGLLENTKQTLLGSVRVLGGNVAEYASSTLHRVTDSVKNAVSTTLAGKSSQKVNPAELGDAIQENEQKNRETLNLYINSIPPPSPEAIAQLKMKLWGSNSPSVPQVPTDSTSRIPESYTKNPPENTEIGIGSSNTLPRVATGEEGKAIANDTTSFVEPPVPNISDEGGVRVENIEGGVRRVTRSIDSIDPKKITAKEKQDIQRTRQELGKDKMEASQKIEDLEQKVSQFLGAHGMSEDEAEAFFREMRKRPHGSIKTEDGSGQSNPPPLSEENPGNDTGSDSEPLTAKESSQMRTWLQERVVQNVLNIKTSSPERQETLKKVVAYIQFRNDSNSAKMKDWNQITADDIKDIDISQLGTFFQDESNREMLFSDPAVLSAFYPSDIQKSDPILGKLKTANALVELSDIFNELGSALNDQAFADQGLKSFDRQYGAILAQPTQPRAIDPDTFLQQQGYQLSPKTNTYVPTRLSSGNFTSTHIGQLDIGSMQPITVNNNVGASINAEITKISEKSYGVQAHGRKFVFDAVDDVHAKNQIDMYLELAGTPLIDNLMKSNDQVFQQYLFKNNEGKLIFQMESGDQKELNLQNKNLFLDYFFHKYLDASDLSKGEYGGVRIKDTSGINIQRSFATNIEFRQTLLSSLRQKNLLTQNDTLRIPEGKNIEQKGAGSVLGNWPG